MSNILSGVFYGQILAAVIVVVIELVVTMLFWIGVEVGWQFVVWCVKRTTVALRIGQEREAAC